MIFRIDERHFGVGGARTTDLLTFLRAAAGRGHSVFIVADVLDSGFAETGIFERWQAGFARDLQEEISLMVEYLRRISPNAVTRGSPVIAVPKATGQDIPKDCIELDFSAASRLAGMPLFVLVENGLSEAAFLRRTMPLRWRQRIVEWEREGCLHFENGGGISEMDRIVDYFSKGKAADPTGLGAAAWCAAHVLVCDRDSNDDGSMSSESHRLQKTCADAGVADRLHVLERRDQESYLPSEALFEIVAQKTDPADRERMTELLNEYLGNSKKRIHSKVPSLGEKSKSWFKNAFLTSNVNWSDEWFERDGSAAEMIEIAERIAAFL